MTNIARWTILKFSLKLIVLMINETLKLMQSKQNSHPTIPMYTINLPMDLSI